MTREEAIAIAGWVGWEFVTHMERLEDIEEVVEWRDLTVAQIKQWAKQKQGKK